MSSSVQNSGGRAAGSSSSFIGSFIDRIAALPRGDRAVLRRNAGRTIADSRGALPIFYRLYHPGESDRDEEIFFLIATLHDLNRTPTSPGDFGATMRAARQSRSGQDPLDRRMRLLLDASFDLIDGYRPGGGEMAFRLRQCVQLAGSRPVGVDWVSLTQDLRSWGHPSKFVQKRWARRYFAAETQPTDA